MLVKYLQKGLENAHYELIDDEEPFYGEVPGLEGVWVTGKMLEECRSSMVHTQGEDMNSLYVGQFA